jgi:hypothetical protein
MNHVVQLLLVDARSMDRDRGSVVQVPGADTKRDKEHIGTVSGSASPRATEPFFSVSGRPI